MSGPGPAAGLGWLRDGHTTGEGYLGSPRDGTLATVVAAVGELEASHQVRPARRLGVSLEYVLAARELAITFAWGSPWVEEQATGPRNTVPAGQVDERLLLGLRELGLDTLCLGASCGPDTVRRLLPLAADLGLEVAALPAPATVGLLEAAPGPVSVESLADLLVAMHLHDRGDAALPDSTAERLALIGSWDADEVVRLSERVAAGGLRITPLLLATWRRASLVNAVNAPALDQAARALPYHQRLASLRAPGALRMGGKEASRHLGVAVLRGDDARRVSRGYDGVQSILTTLISTGHPLIGGSGAPGIGLCPGYAAREELDLWSSLTGAQERVATAFGLEGPATTAVPAERSRERVDV